MNKEYSIENLLKGIDDCPCGKKHESSLDKAIIETGAIDKLSLCVKHYNGKKAFIVADKNTFGAAGEKVINNLDSNKILHSEFIFSNDIVEPDEYSIGSAILYFDKSHNIIIGIGSGVINDICKILANIMCLPYIIVATAPSMDGYASSTSSVIRDGLKVSVDSVCPNVIIGDIDVLRNAPMDMIYAGFGDIIAKYISLCEWKIGNIVTGEYYCEEVFNIVYYSLKKCIDSAMGIVNRDEEAIKNFMEALVISGIAASFAGVSRPVSGVEHYFSHIWDMRALEFGTPCSLHGIQCGIGTLLAIKGYEELKKITPDREKAIEFTENFDDENCFNNLERYLGKAGKLIIKNEKAEDRYNRAEHLKRLDIIIENWDKIKAVIDSYIPSYEELYDLFKKIGAPTKTEDIGILKEEIGITLKATKDIRNKYILSTLLWDIGNIDEIAEIY